MKDANLGMVMATLIAAPVVIVCCSGSIVLGGLIAGAATWFTGNNILMSGLVAVAVGILILAYKSYQRSRNDNSLNIKERTQHE
jgi:type III secretory pathway component EscT